MKFFIELVACCRCSSNRAHSIVEEEEILVPVVVESSSDINIITYKRRHRRRRGSVRSTGSLPEWKPSLSSISEETVHALPPRANSTRNLAKKVAPARPHRAKPRFSRIACLATLVPTPFMM